MKIVFFSLANSEIRETWHGEDSADIDGLRGAAIGHAAQHGYRSYIASDGDSPGLIERLYPDPRIISEDERKLHRAAVTLLGGTSKGVEHVH